MEDVKGLHLWLVDVSTGVSKQGLYVLTAKHDVSAAIKKATTVIRDKNWEFNDPSNRSNRIIRVEYSGSIDA